MLKDFSENPMEAYDYDPRWMYNKDSLKGIKLLFIDPDEIDSQFIANMLAKHGAKSTICPTAHQALQKLRENNFNVIIIRRELIECNDIDPVTFLTDIHEIVPDIKIVLDTDEDEIKEYFDSLNEKLKIALMDHCYALISTIIDEETFGEVIRAAAGLQYDPQFPLHKYLIKNILLRTADRDEDETIQEVQKIIPTKRHGKGGKKYFFKKEFAKLIKAVYDNRLEICKIDKYCPIPYNSLLTISTCIRLWERWDKFKGTCSCGGLAIGVDFVKPLLRSGWTKLVCTKCGNFLEVISKNNVETEARSFLNLYHPLTGKCLYNGMPCGPKRPVIEILKKVNPKALSNIAESFLDKDDLPDFRLLNLKKEFKKDIMLRKKEQLEVNDEKLKINNNSIIIRNEALQAKYRGGLKAFFKKYYPWRNKDICVYDDGSYISGEFLMKDLEKYKFIFKVDYFVVDFWSVKNLNNRQYMRPDWQGVDWLKVIIENDLVYVKYIPEEDRVFEPTYKNGAGVPLGYFSLVIKTESIRQKYPLGLNGLIKKCIKHEIVWDANEDLFVIRTVSLYDIYVIINILDIRDSGLQCRISPVDYYIIELHENDNFKIGDNEKDVQEIIDAYEISIKTCDDGFLIPLIENGQKVLKLNKNKF